MYLTSVAIAAPTFIVSWTVTRVVRDVALRRSLLDRPNERSAHVRPTPRLGGLGIMAAFLPAAAAVAIGSGSGTRAVVTIAATATIAALGLVDDLRPIAARWRLGVQLLAAGSVVAVNASSVAAAWAFLPIPAPILALFSVLWIVWLTNLYNFMDGIDGLAGGQAAIAGTAIAVVAFGSGAEAQGTLVVALVGAALGFLVHNFPPASIFMGDVGSTAIGFFLACVPFLPGGGGVPGEVVAIALSLFVLDATWTLIRRLARGERVYQAHRSHWYQRPLACGVPHRAITLRAFAGMALVGAAAIAYGASALPGRVVSGAVPFAVFAAAAATVRALERRKAREEAEVREPPRRAAAG